MLKDHEIALFVNRLTEAAQTYKDCQQLREQLRKIVLDFLAQNLAQ